ncbi:MAG: T9SS type A sorting domain-containing protein [Bacteroidales bacterium]|nr:T9SS type A sorting domain-containing protein [Bacteroidales bacterium]
MKSRYYILTILLVLTISIVTSAGNSLFPIPDNRGVSFILFPNPVIEGTFTVEAETNIEKIEIVSILGQLILSEEPEPSKNSVRLNIKDFKSGIYLVKISFTDKSTATKKVWVK